MINNDWLTLQPVLSYSEAIFYFIDSVRNVGKSWSIARRTWRRAYKKGKKTIIVRLFRKEATIAAAQMYDSADIIDFCTGLIPYDKKTKKGNFKKVGNTCYIKRCGRWRWFLKTVSLSEFKNMRSADDVDCDTIIFDEYTTTPSKYKRYQGNIAEDFLDLLVTIMRQHEVRALFCGNKEAVYNPFYAYLGIPPLQDDFEGIRYYKENSVARQQWNKEVGKPNRAKEKLKKALKGTRYGEYLYKAKTRTQTAITYYQAPQQARLYEQFYVQNTPLLVLFFDDYFYITCKPDLTKGCYTDKQYPELKNATIYTPPARVRYEKLIHAFLNNKVRYENGRAAEASIALAKMLKINL